VDKGVIMISKIVTSALLLTFLVSCSSDDIQDFIDDTKKRYFEEKVAGVVDESGSVTEGVENNISISGQEEALLLAHNEARGAVNVLTKLVWNKTLQQDAQSYANTLANSGAWEHDPKNHEGYSNGPYGENLYASTSKPTLKDAADAWIKEKRDYHYGKVGDASTCNKDAICGHYTQVIWKETSQVGCAIAKYSTGNMKNWYVVVCKYKTPGNYEGETPY
jgi:hypothetical protein